MHGNLALISPPQQIEMQEEVLLEKTDCGIVFYLVDHELDCDSEVNGKV